MKITYKKAFDVDYSREFGGERRIYKQYSIFVDGKYIFRCNLGVEPPDYSKRYQVIDYPSGTYRKFETIQEAKHKISELLGIKT